MVTERQAGSRRKGVPGIGTRVEASRMGTRLRSSSLLVAQERNILCMAPATENGQSTQAPKIIGPTQGLGCRPSRSGLFALGKNSGQKL